MVLCMRSHRLPDTRTEESQRRNQGEFVAERAWRRRITGAPKRFSSRERREADV